MQAIFRLIKFALVLAIVVGALVGVSYLGARTTAAKMIGPERALQGREVELQWKGVETLPNKPRAWVFRYRVSRLPGVPSAEIYVSLTGDLITTRPRDLDRRLEAFARAREP